jgi:quercetin dioxygenase-like cupin family protein
MAQARTDRPQPMALNRFDLNTELTRLWADAPIQAHGRDSLTLVRDLSLDLVLVSLKAKAHLPEHKASGAISVLVLDGRILFRAFGERLELGVHGLVTLPARMLHEVEALEDSAILITIVAPITHDDPVGLVKEMAVFSKA